MATLVNKKMGSPQGKSQNGLQSCWWLKVGDNFRMLVTELTVTVRDDYTPHDTRWQCTAKLFIMACLDAYM